MAVSRVDIFGEAVDLGLRHNWKQEYRTVMSWLGASWIKIVSIFRGDEYAVLGICNDIFKRRMQADTLSQVSPRILKKISLEVKNAPERFSIELFQKALYFANRHYPRTEALVDCLSPLIEREKVLHPATPPLPPIDDLWGAELIKRITPENAMQVFTMRQKGMTILHNSHLWTADELKRQFVATLTSKQRVEILSQLDEYPNNPGIKGHPVLHNFVTVNREAAVGALLSGLSQDEIVQVLEVGRPIHDACSQCETGAITTILDLLTPEMRVKMLTKHDSDGIPAFMYACTVARGTHLVLEEIVKKLATPEDVLEVVSASDRELYSPLHTLCRRDKELAFLLVVDKIPAEHALFAQKTTKGGRALDYAAELLSTDEGRRIFVALVKKMSAEQLVTAINESKMLSTVVRQSDAETLEVLLNKLPSKERVKMLKEKDDAKMTPLAYAKARHRDPQIAALLLKKRPT